MYEVFFYRSNLWMHAHRVLWILEEIIPTAKKYFDFDEEKARVLALVHDDAEMITGDIQAGHKAMMTEEELKKVDQSEENAIEQLVDIYPKTVHGYSYKELLTHALKKDSIEAQLVSYADKVDAYCESMHELLAGNITAIRTVLFNAKARLEFHKKFPALEKFLNDLDSPLVNTEAFLSPFKVEFGNYKNYNKPFNSETIHATSDFLFYNMWKDVILKKAGEEGLDYLISQKEYLKK